MDYAVAFGQVIITNAPNLAGFAMPLLVEFCNKDIENDKLRFIMEIAMCFLFAVTLHWQQIALGSPDSAVTTAGVLFLESEMLFKLYFRNSWLRGKIQQLGKPGTSGVDTTETVPTQ